MRRQWYDSLSPTSRPQTNIPLAGDNIAFEWRTDRNIPAASYPLKDGSIPVGVTDDSHRGPCAIYMKKVSDATTATATGDGWFKISHEGVINNDFCTDRLRKASAPQTGTIPSGIEPGDYLIRAELITLNDAAPAQDAGGKEQPQFYISCAQITVSGTSGSITPDTVSIPGYLNHDSPGLIYNIWTKKDFSDYQIPGPAPLASSGGGGGTGSNPAPSKVVSNTPASTTVAPAQPTGDGDDGYVPEPTTTVSPADDTPSNPTGRVTTTTRTTLTTRTTTRAPERTSGNWNDNDSGSWGSTRGGRGRGRGRYRGNTRRQVYA